MRPLWLFCTAESQIRETFIYQNRTKRC